LYFGVACRQLTGFVEEGWRFITQARGGLQIGIVKGALFPRQGRGNNICRLLTAVGAGNREGIHERKHPGAGNGQTQAGSGFDKKLASIGFHDGHLQRSDEDKENPWATGILSAARMRDSATRPSRAGFTAWPAKRRNMIKIMWV
jgi:hypothetical protein